MLVVFAVVNIKEEMILLLLLEEKYVVVNVIKTKINVIDLIVKEFAEVMPKKMYAENAEETVLIGKQDIVIVMEVK